MDEGSKKVSPKFIPLQNQTEIDSLESLQQLGIFVIIFFFLIKKRGLELDL
jgi:hypothetical protein